ncbi:MAG: hypothetical protein AAFV53_17245 [Myxococcota bacterium]
MTPDVRAFRRSARLWLPAWRQVRSAYYRYRRLSKDTPYADRFRRVDQYIREVEAHYAALGASSRLMKRRERYRPDVRALQLAIELRCPRAPNNETRELLESMCDALQTFEMRLYG